VKLVHKLPTWYGAVMADDLQELRAAQTALTPKEQENSTILRTDSILDAMEKQAWMQRNNQVLATIKWVEPAPPAAADVKNIADAAEGLLAEWAKKPDAGDLTALREQVDLLSGALRDNSDEMVKEMRIGAWQDAFLEELRQLVSGFVPPPLDLATLPPELRDHYVSYNAGVAEPRSERGAGTEGAAKPTYALYVYPKEDLWAGDRLGKFVAELEERMRGQPSDVTLTGIAVQLFHSTEEIHHAFMMSTVYALGLIFVLVLLDLRNLSQTLLAISVLGFGLPMLLLMMWIWRALGEPFGIPGSWNFANFFGLPILIGAGHEYGVFMVHRYRETLHDPRRVWQRWDVSDRALLLCAIVTSCSFGFLAFAHHRGLASLGWVMAVGTVCIYLATVVVLRPILQWRLQGKRLHGETTTTETRRHEVTKDHEVGK